MNNPLLNPVQVRYSDDGSFIYVSINPREVLQQLAAEDVLEALIETGFSSFEYQLEQETLEELTRLPWQRLNRVVIRRIAYRVEFDLKVSLSPDRMHAFISVKPAYAQEKILRERLIERLAHAGVRQGLIESAIEEVLQTTEASHLEIAVGKLPEHGQDSWLEFLCPELNLEQLPLVKRGQRLARRYPPTPGVDGYKVSGQVLAARGGQLATLTAGEGCAFDALDPDLLLATAEGLPLVQGSYVRVSPLVRVSADKLESFYLHSVLIEGDLPAGSELRSAGHILVQGSINGGELQAEGDIYISAEVQGPVYLRAVGSIYVQQVTQSLLHSGQDLILQQKLRHCQAFVAGRLKGPSATLSGGSLQCLKGLELGQLGNKWSDPTSCHLGPSAYFYESLYSLQAELQDHHQRLEAALRHLIRQRSLLGAGPEVERLQQQQQALVYREHALKAELESLKCLLEAEFEAQGSILHKIYPKAQLLNESGALEIQTLSSGGHLRCLAGQALEFQAFERVPA